MTPIETKQAGFFHAFKDEILLFSTQSQCFQLLEGLLNVVKQNDEVGYKICKNMIFDATDFEKDWLIVASEKVILKKIDDFKS
jgi:hypothetical protein